MVGDELTSTGRRRWALAGAIAVLAVATLIWLQLPISRAYIDLEVYRLGGRTWRAGADLYGKLPPVLGHEVLPFTYPPLAAIVFAPMSLMGSDPAAATMFALSVAALAGTLWLVSTRIRPHWAITSRLALVTAISAAALYLEPVRETLGFGQVNLILMFLVAADLLIDKPFWPRGTLIGIAAAIKLTPAAFILFFVAGRNWRAALTTVISGAAAVAVGLVLAWNDSIEYWLGGTLMSTDRIGSPRFSSNQSLKGMIFRLGFSDGVGTALWLGASAVVVVIALITMRRLLADGHRAVAMLVNAAAVLLISPVSWSHHWVWIVPALMVVADVARRQSRPLLYAVIAVVTGAYYLGPHWVVPSGYNLELAWSVGQSLVGDFYGLSALIALGCCFVVSRTTSTASAPPATSDTATGRSGSVSAD